MKHFIDFETTGFDPWTHSAVSLAWIITDDNYNIIAKFYEECRPNVINRKTWTKEAQRIHKFTVKEILTKQSETQLCVKLINFLRKHCNGERGHLYYHADSHIDHRFLMGILHKNLDKHIYEIYKHIYSHGHRNTMVDFRNHLGPRLYGLSALATHYGVVLKHHNALSDTECLLECYRRMEEEKQLNQAC